MYCKKNLLLSIMWFLLIPCWSQENLETALRYINEKKFSLAIPLLEKEYQADSQNIKVIEALSTAYYNTEGMRYNAILYAERGLAISPNNHILYALKIKSLMQDNSAEEAIKFINTNIRRKDAASYYDLLKRGQCKYNLGHKTAALLDLEAAYSLNGNDPETLFSLGYVKSMLSNDKEYDNKYIEMALEMIESEEDIFFNTRELANIYVIKAVQADKTGNDSEADKYYDKALFFNKKNVDANLWKGRKEYLVNRYNAALTCFENAASPENGQYKKNEIKAYTALCYYRLSLRQQALELLNQSVHAGSKLGPVYLFRGIINYENNKTQLAIEDFIKAVKHEHNDSELSWHAANGEGFLSYLNARYPDIIEQVDPYAGFYEYYSKEYDEY